MKGLKLFSKEPKCPKCLDEWTERKFFYTSDGKPEYINVKCMGCGYSWDMETADTEQNRVILEVKEKIEEETPESLKLLRDTQAETEKKAIEEVG